MEHVEIKGYSGDAKTLTKMLGIGITITNIQLEEKNGERIFLVDFESKVIGRPALYSAEQICSLHKEGKRVCEIARIVGCTRTYVYKVLKSQEGEEAHE